MGGLFRSVCVAALLALPASASAGANHTGAAAGGAVAGLVCGGATLTYSRLRAGTGEDSPLLWHSTSGPGWIVVFFAEHAAVGGVTGAFGDGAREGFVIGGAVTCGLDIVYIVASEILYAQEEPVVALAERDDSGRWRFGVPPIAVGKRSAWIPLLSVRF